MTALIPLFKMIFFDFVCFGWVLWHINHCRSLIPNFIHINSSISNNSVLQKYIVLMSKNSSLNNFFAYTQLNVKTVIFQAVQFSINTVSLSNTVLFQTIKFSIQKQFSFKQLSLA